MTTNYWRFTVHKNWLGAGGHGWGNHMEAYSEAFLPVESVDLYDAAIALADAERLIHLPQVWFDRVVISTWDNDGDPYAPETFRSIPLGFLGQRGSVAGDRVDLNAVLKVRKTTQYGRNGKLAYRGVLAESDVTASASGFWELTPTSTVGPSGADWAAYQAKLGPYLGGQGSPIYFAVIGVTGTVVQEVNPRAVMALESYGAGFNRMNHRFYNQAGTP